MMRALLLASALLAHGLLAQDSTFASTGDVSSSPRVYEVVPDQSDDINAAIDSSVEHMNFIVRPIARHRLRVNNPLPQRLELTFARDTITIWIGGQPPAVLPRDGTTVPWRDIAGDKCKVSLAIAGDTLIEHVAAHGGQSETRFVIMDAGRHIREDVRISSSHLPRPVVYSVMFAKTP